MRVKSLFIFPLLINQLAFAQGVLSVDQQSSDETRVLEGQVGAPGPAPAQSFTPTLSGVDFVRLWIILGNRGQGLAVNVRSESPDGPLLGTSATVTIPSQSFTGALTFLFADRVALTPGTAYYLQPVPVGGGGFTLNQSLYQYPGGMLYANGQPSFTDLWFQEGILVPEPGVGSLLLAGVALLVLRRQKT